MQTNINIESLAVAVSYLSCEYRLLDGTGAMRTGAIITAEMWAEGLAYGRGSCDSYDRLVARHMLPQLTDAEWARIAQRAAYLAR